MKTKSFLLATAGSTVDGRVIDDKMLDEMAAGYDPKTYGARLNIEHIRGISGDKPFRAYGDVLELSVAEVDVKFHDKTEKRKGLFGVFDVTEDAKALNSAGQKVYPSIEIEPNFAGKGKAYLMGCALTDSPASIATERLQFNRQMPGTIILSRGADGQGSEPGALEFADVTEGQGGEGFLAGLKGVLDGFAAKFSPAKPAEDAPKEPAGSKPPAFDFAEMRPLFEQLGQTFSASLDGLRTELRGEVDGLCVKLKKLEDAREATPAPGYTARPPANGSNGQYSKTDC